MCFYITTSASSDLRTQNDIGQIHGKNILFLLFILLHVSRYDTQYLFKIYEKKYLYGLDIISNLFTEIFQFRDDVINLYFHVFLFDLDAPDLFFNVSTAAPLVLFQFEDEVLG